MEDSLKETFRELTDSSNKARAIAHRVTAATKAVIASNFGSNLDNEDGFQTDVIGQLSSTIKTKNADSYGVSSELVIDIFPEGRARLIASWYENGSDEPGNRMEKILYFSGSDTPGNVAGRILAGIVCINDNQVAESFDRFVRAELSPSATNAQHDDVPSK